MSPSPTNPFNVLHYGMADLTGGLCQITQINAYGLMTKGFLWQAGEIWFYPEDMDGIATGWTAAAGYTGCAAASLITTSWTVSTDFGQYEYPG